MDFSCLYTVTASRFSAVTLLKFSEGAGGVAYLVLGGFVTLSYCLSGRKKKSVESGRLWFFPPYLKCLSDGL